MKQMLSMYGIKPWDRSGPARAPGKGSSLPMDAFFCRLLKLAACSAAVLGILSCNSRPTAGDTPKKVFYLNSYHDTYGTSPQILAGIREALEGKPVDLQVFYLDGKRNPQEGQIAGKVAEALDRIRSFGPDVIIASDDDAVKWVVVPHLKRKATPVVFCGVNWSAAPYGLPAGNVTGMVEVVPVEETIRTVQAYYPGLKKLAVLSENTVSENKNRQFLDTTFRRLGLRTQYLLVDDFGAWKEKFREAGQTADLIYLPTNGGIKGWDEAQARTFVGQHIVKPVIACDDFMMPYAVLGFTKIAREQGQWAGQQAWQILQGKRSAEIPLARNRQSQAWFNPVLARKINFRPDSSFTGSAKIIADNL